MPILVWFLGVIYKHLFQVPSGFLEYTTFKGEILFQYLLRSIMQYMHFDYYSD